MTFRQERETATSPKSEQINEKREQLSPPHPVPMLTPQMARLEPRMDFTVATPKSPKIYPYYSRSFCKAPLQPTGTGRHLQGRIQRIKPKTESPAVSHHHKEPLATGETERREQMGSDGDTELGAGAGRVNLSQLLQREHILNLFRDPDPEPSHKPSGHLGSQTPRCPPARAQDKELGAKILPR